MATGDRFEEIDWDELGGIGLTGRGKQMVGFVVLYAAALLYDAVLLPEGTPTLTIPGALPVVGGIPWDVSSVDWLFIVTLAVGYFYAVLPLYKHPRLAAYYWGRFKRNRAAVASAVYLLVIFAIGMLGPAFVSDPQVQPLEGLQPPVFASVDSSVPIQCIGEVEGGMCRGTWKHPLGTTSEGKDLLVLLILGMRVSMQVGLITMMLVITVGSLVGTTAAYFGGYVDEVLMRYVDLQATFPTFFLFLILSFLFTPSLFLLIGLFGLLGWEGTARLVRSEALQRTEEEYVMAARSAGASDAWIIRRHIFPNVSNSIITNATLLIPAFILTEAALAFLALTDPSVESWGKTIAAGRNSLSTAWWVATIPGIFLFFTILAFNFIGDAMRDALDPRSEGRT